MTTPRVYYVYAGMCANGTLELDAVVNGKRSTERNARLGGRWSRRDVRIFASLDEVRKSHTWGLSAYTPFVPVACETRRVRTVLVDKKHSVRVAQVRLLRIMRDEDELKARDTTTFRLADRAGGFLALVRRPEEAERMSVAHEMIGAAMDAYCAAHADMAAKGQWLGVRVGCTFDDFPASEWHDRQLKRSDDLVRVYRDRLVPAVPTLRRAEHLDDVLRSASVRNYMARKRTAT